MRYIILGAVTSGTILMMCVVGAAILWPLFYYTIKAAVKNGTAEAIRETKQQQKENITRADDRLSKKRDNYTGRDN